MPKAPTAAAAASIRQLTGGSAEEAVNPLVQEKFNTMMTATHPTAQGEVEAVVSFILEARKKVLERFTSLLEFTEMRNEADMKQLPTNFYEPLCREYHLHLNKFTEHKEEEWKALLADRKNRFKKMMVIFTTFRKLLTVYTRVCPELQFDDNKSTAYNFHVLWTCIRHEIHNVSSSPGLVTVDANSNVSGSQLLCVVETTEDQEPVLSSITRNGLEKLAAKLLEVIPSRTALKKKTPKRKGTGAGTSGSATKIPRPITSTAPPLGDEAAGAGTSVPAMTKPPPPPLPTNNVEASGSTKEPPTIGTELELVASEPSPRRGKRVKAAANELGGDAEAEGEEQLDNDNGSFGSQRSSVASAQRDGIDSDDGPRWCNNADEAFEESMLNWLRQLEVPAWALSALLKAKPSLPGRLIPDRLAPISAEDEAYLQERLNESQAEAQQRPAAALLRPIPLTATAMPIALCALLDFKSLPEETLNRWVELLSVRDSTRFTEGTTTKRSHAFQTGFFLRVQEVGCGGDGDYHNRYYRVARAPQKVPGGDIFQLDKLFFPISRSSNHWVLVGVFMNGKRIQVYDSKGEPGLDEVDAILEYLKDEYRAKNHQEMKLSDWTVVLCDEKSCPQQRNDDDCGVFCCMFMDLLMSNEPLVIDQSQVPMFRKKMALSLLRGTL